MGGPDYWLARGPQQITYATGQGCYSSSKNLHISFYKYREFYSLWKKCTYDSLHIDKMADYQHTLHISTHNAEKNYSSLGPSTVEMGACVVFLFIED